MYNIPKEYAHNKVLNKSHFIPKEESPRNKKIMRDHLVKVRLGYQIEGSAIPSYQTQEYYVSIIMLLDIELKELKYAEIINKIFQKIFKGFLMIKFTDSKGHVRYGLGYKRLSKVDKNEIVLEDSFVTEAFTEDFLDDRYDAYKESFNYHHIVNKFNKLSFYTEAMIKVYMVDHIEDITNSRQILNSNVWYSQKNMLKVYQLLNEIIEVKEKSRRANLIKERIEYNKELVKLNNKLEEIINESI